MVRQQSVVRCTAVAASAQQFALLPQPNGMTSQTATRRSAVFASG
jgi:hypothetical protein